jgi:hypothetical protein
MTNINPKFHRVERVSNTIELGRQAKPSGRASGIIGRPEPNRRIRVSRHISGKLIMEIDGRDSMTLLPEQAFRLAAGIFKGLGIEMEYGWDGRPSGRASK